MFFETVISTFDKSYYTDRLEKLTGRSRRYWSFFPILRLQLILKQELIKEAKMREVSYGTED